MAIEKYYLVFHQTKHNSLDGAVLNEVIHLMQSHWISIYVLEKEKLTEETKKIKNVTMKSGNEILHREEPHLEKEE